MESEEYMFNSQKFIQDLLIARELGNGSNLNG